MLDHRLLLDRDGAQYCAGAAFACLQPLLSILEPLGINQAGQRLTGLAELADILQQEGPIGGLLSSLVKESVQPVRAILFDKNDATNWALGWHQDRTIVVRERRNLQGFGPWTIKQGILHVAPPESILAQMLTVRIHLDAVPDDNAPLLIALGTHALGKIGENDIAHHVANHYIYSCTALAGDIWVYRTPILHASERARGGQRRRVLQVDYATDALPGGLEWLGV